MKAEEIGPCPFYRSTALSGRTEENHKNLCKDGKVFGQDSNKRAPRQATAVVTAMP